MNTEEQRQHLKFLGELLQREKEADFRSYLNAVRENPLQERARLGYTWYPLQVLQTGFALGEKAFVVVERHTHNDAPHQLRAGQPVRLFTQTPHVDEPEKQGIIHYVERNRMKIILHARDVPDWVQMGRLGVDMLFDDRSYQEMERALETVITARSNRLAELRAVLCSTTETHPIRQLYAESEPIPETDSMALNDSQQQAVHAILHNPDLSIVHGPPGTGKTTTIVAAIKALCKTENTVLVAAPSNTAADLLTERLARNGLNVVRVGNISRVDEEVMQHTPDALLAAHPEARNIKKVKIEAAAIRREARRFKRSFNAEDRRERQHLKEQAKELEAWARVLEDRILNEILDGAQAITCTLVGAAHPLLEKRYFRTCIIDEAAQALEPACWIPIIKSSRVVLAGDPYQLPPTVKDSDAARAGLTVTLMERCLKQLPDRSRLLTVQYRMHRAIMGFSNRYFYENALEAHHSVAQRSLSSEAPREAEISFIDTAGCGFDEQVEEATGILHRTLSRYNPDEATLVREHVYRLFQYLGHALPILETTGWSDRALPTVGILSPYREQVNRLEGLFLEDPLLAPLLKAGIFTINTIDGFQGQERDAIYISLVRSNEKHEIGFLQDYRRMNVAMTRARMMLVVIGDSATIGANKFYQEFLDYCSEHGAYRTAWEFMT